MISDPLDIPSLEAVLAAQLNQLSEDPCDFPSGVAFRLAYTEGDNHGELLEYVDARDGFKVGFDMALKLAVAALTNPVRPSFARLREIVSQTRAGIEHEHMQRVEWTKLNKKSAGAAKH